MGFATNHVQTSTICNAAQCERQRFHLGFDCLWQVNTVRTTSLKNLSTYIIYPSAELTWEKVNNYPQVGSQVKPALGEIIVTITFASVVVKQVKFLLQQTQNCTIFFFDLSMQILNIHWGFQYWNLIKSSGKPYIKLPTNFVFVYVKSSCKAFITTNQVHTLILWNQTKVHVLF